MSGAKVTEARTPDQQINGLFEWWSMSHDNQWPQCPLDEMRGNIRDVIADATEQARREEREACARLVEASLDEPLHECVDDIAAAIRARTSEAPADEGTRTG